MNNHIKFYFLFSFFLFSCDTDSQIIQPVDCNGTVGGNATADNCGVCDEISSNDCVLDCANVWGGNSVSDIDGNCYEILEIGNQLWFAENLKVTHYANGDPINGTVFEDQVWSQVHGNISLTNIEYSELPGRYCAFNNDQNNIDILGLYYNGQAVNDDRGLCPEGYHVPSNGEWDAMETYLESQNIEPINYQLSDSPYCQASSNSSGFSGGFGGNRDYNNGQFVSYELGSWYWTSTMDGNSLIRQIYKAIGCSDLDYVSTGTASYNGSAMNIRCIKD